MYLQKYFEKGIRYDGRKLKELREIRIIRNPSETAEGSVIVEMGNTKVIAGVKMAIEKPFPDTPDQGILMVNAELMPLSSPDFESGPPGIESIELARVIDRGIRESQAIDTKKLCVEKGEKVWSVMVDICTLNHDGNLIDASGLAALLALKEAKLPAYDGEQLDYKHLTDEKLSISKHPIPVTVFKIGNYFIVDPTKEEEQNYDARLTVTTMEDGKICALQKNGNSGLSIDDISKMIDIAKEKANEIRKKVGL